MIQQQEIDMARISDSLGIAREEIGEKKPKAENVSVKDKCTVFGEQFKKFGDATTFHGVKYATDYKLNRFRR